MTEGQSPTVRRRQLGMELRRLREHANVSAIEAGERIGRSDSTISRFETGRVTIRQKVLVQLLDLYGAADEETQAVLDLAREASKRGWWHAHGDAVPPWFEVFIGLEAEAASIQTYQPQLVPGLLQTEAYARAVIETDHPGMPDEEIDRLVALRLARQKLLTRSNPPQLWAVMSEAALRHAIGGPAAMQEQLLKLRDTRRLACVTLQVLPFAAGAHPGMLGPFHLLEFPPPSEARVSYVEYLTGSMYLEKPEEVRRYRLVFDHLRAAALPPNESIALISAVIEEMTS
ncbi:helix-turn-helix domain-containing protein [Streptosporangium subroseum]|uniref:helix-turn-helix domain-containing protein n=1 Tax=Streptosporangium subroseum TaxID=106412 RepID=UPI00308C5920|nr:helix-turn-helix domain-containing protein [Streptosporangium subroseum]